MKPNMWWDLINTPRKAGCCLVLLLGFFAIAYTKLAHAELTDAQLLQKFWMVYAAVIAAAVGAWIVYPKH